MTRNEYIKEFFKFLKEQGAFEAFKANILEVKSLTGKVAVSDDRVFTKMLEKCPLPERSFVSIAFYWEQSPEGFEFWSNIRDMWLNRLNNLNNN